MALAQEAPGAPGRSPPPPGGGARDEAAFRRAELSRATGSPTLEGNHIRLQFEGSITFESWIEAVERAERFVYFENYVVRDDRTGRAFRDALAAKAREGVPVRVVYDWLGCWATPRSYWRPLVDAGAQVRAFNPPSLALGDPLGALQRDHRKLVVVDGDVAFVGGFCVGDEWAGGPRRPPWRDTGVEIHGPAARAAALAFERLWAEMGEPCWMAATMREPDRAGGMPVWIIEGEPGRARVYRTLHLTAALARRRIWITDAYFVAPRSVSEALTAAAQHGVDVRILVPAHNNWPWVRSISRGGYRFLLQSGVRVFEWQGPMMHAKTSVVDGTWCRVGSSNLNAASLMGNWELDVGVLDRGLAAQLEGLFLADLASCREIVLPRRRAAAQAAGRLHEPPRPLVSLDPEGPLHQRLEDLRAQGGRLGLAGLVRAGSAFGGALAGNRTLGREDRTVLGSVAVAILVVAAVAVVFPTVVGWGFAVVALWFGTVTGIRALAQARRARAEEREGDQQGLTREGEGKAS